MPERFVRELPNHSVSRDALASALMAPVVGFEHAALDHRAIRLEALPNGFEADAVEAAERGQAGRDEGSVVNVEVFQIDSVRTSIFAETSTPYFSIVALRLLHSRSRRAS